jgi:ribonucleotide monophosphatase NagD (HAD superfamily)
MGVSPGDAAMVGDDVESDVGGAMAAGLAGILVRTGKYEPGAEGHISPPPTAVVDDLAAAVAWLLAGA